MSPTDDGRIGPPESAPAPAASGALPAGLTPGACEAFRDVEAEFREGLSGELRCRRRFRADLTRDDVYDARVIVARAMCLTRGRSDPGAAADSGAAQKQRAASLRALGAGMFAVGSVGVASMHPYLHSPWQVALMAVFAVLGLVGVGLTWRGRQNLDVSDEFSS